MGGYIGILTKELLGPPFHSAVRTCLCRLEGTFSGMARAKIIDPPYLVLNRGCRGVSPRLMVHIPYPCWNYLNIW